MPFTVSHVAAVLPAHRPLSRARVFSAAVIGSMVPDFGLLLPGSYERWQTHSAPALFTFCLPVGLLAYCLTQWLIKPAVLEVLPDGPYARLVAERAPSAAWGSGRFWLGVVLAILLGAATHLLWDGFTHENARGVRLFSELAQYGPQMAGHSLRLYRWLQYGSSVVGLGLVAVALAVWLHHARAPAPPPLRRLSHAERLLWCGVYVALPLLLIVWMALQAGGFLPLGPELNVIGIASVRAAALSLLLVSVLLRLRLGAAGQVR